MPMKNLVIEVLEDTIVDDNFINCLKELKNKGFLIAIDDFVMQDNLLPILEFASFVKVDFLLLDKSYRKLVIDKYRRDDIKFIAEKVETREDFENALIYGYDYFQGYFFSKPELISGKKIPENKYVYLELIRECSQEFINFNKVEKILSKDLSLTVKLLKYVNSPFFGFRDKITSIKHALVLLGESEISKWLAIISYVNLSDSRSLEVVRFSLFKGKLLELLATESPLLKKYRDKLFLSGLLSNVETLLQKPAKDILDELSISEDIKRAILKEDKNIIYYMLILLDFYEQGRWEEVDTLLNKIKVFSEVFMNCYLQSINWADDIITIH